MRVQHLVKPDSTAISHHLFYYFVDHQSNFFRLIIDTDVKGAKASDSSLVQVQTILQKYGCSLDSVAVVDPINCASSTTITTTKQLFAKTPPVAQAQAFARTAALDNSSALAPPQKSPMLMSANSTQVKGTHKNQKDTTINKLRIKRKKEIREKIKKHQDSIKTVSLNHKKDSIRNPVRKLNKKGVGLENDTTQITKGQKSKPKRKKKERQLTPLEKKRKG